MILSPLNESGHPVDWWFLYKVPKLAGGDGSAAATGYEYAYYDDLAGKVLRSPNRLDQDQGALHLTLDALFCKAGENTGWLLYNDERPDGGSDNGALGHTKGVLGFDLDSGTAIWLLHSWPKYVDPNATSMPTPIYGQTFICIAITLDSARILATQMATHQQPQIFASRLPDGLAADDPLRMLAGPINTDDPGNASVLSFTSRGGLEFQVIAKNRDWGQDFWNDLVGPVLQEDIDVETWIRGPIAPELDSDGIHKTYDVKYITLESIGLPWAWPETRDHAKWAISLKDHWICVGDINRMISQEKRGGCTIAFQDETLWTLLSQTDLLTPPGGQSQAQGLNAVRHTHQLA